MSLWSIPNPTPRSYAGTPAVGGSPAVGERAPAVASAGLAPLAEKVSSFQPAIIPGVLAQSTAAIGSLGLRAAAAPAAAETAPAPGRNEKPILARLSASRGSRVVWFLVGLWIVNIFDLVLTVLAHQQGYLDEANPIALHLLNRGAIAIIVYKTVLVWLGSYPLYRYRDRRITEWAVMIVALVYVSVAFRWSLCYELYHLTSTETIPIAELNRLTGG